MSGVGTALGLARSLVQYYGQPWRRPRLARLYRPFVPAGGLCFDIGAHVGQRTRCWRRLGARVVAVEPQRACLAVLEALCGNDAGVTIVAAALGREPGEATLYAADRTPTVASLSSEWIAARAPGSRLRARRVARRRPRAGDDARRPDRRARRAGLREDRRRGLRSRGARRAGASAPRAVDRVRQRDAGRDRSLPRAARDAR
jgi:hypothetical protein